MAPSSVVLMTNRAFLASDFTRGLGVPFLRRFSGDRSDSIAPLPATACAADRAGRWVIIFLVLLHLLKTAAFIAAGQTPLIGDSAHYWFDAGRMIGGDWLMIATEPEVVRTPAYPFFLALCRMVFGVHALTAAIALQQSFILITVLLTAWVCRRLTGSKLAAIVALVLGLFCTSHNSIAMGASSDVLLGLSLLATVTLWILWWERPAAGRAALIGLLIGAMVLIKPVAELVWVPLLMAMAFRLFELRQVRRLWLHALCLVLATGVVVGPWVVRNRVCCGRFFLTRAMGRTLWWSCLQSRPDNVLVPLLPFGDGPATRRACELLHVEQLSHGKNLALELTHHGYSESQAEEITCSVCSEAIRAHPGRYLWGRFLRFGWFWVTPNGTWRPGTGTLRGLGQLPPNEDGPEVMAAATYFDQHAWQARWYAERGPLIFLWYPHPLLYAIAALVAAAGIVMLLRRPPYRAIGVAIGLLLLYFSAVTVIGAAPEYRYRMILEPLMIIAVTPLLAGGLRRIAAACGVGIPSEPGHVC
jgi:4-amino-4-deoxy-L-arabinose transferase-like glycosyltransferase